MSEGLEISIGGHDEVAPRFIVERDSDGLSLSVANPSAQRFAVKRDDDALTLDVLPIPKRITEYTLHIFYTGHEDEYYLFTTYPHYTLAVDILLVGGGGSGGGGLGGGGGGGEVHVSHKRGIDGDYQAVTGGGGVPVGIISSPGAPSYFFPLDGEWIKSAAGGGSGGFCSSPYGPDSEGVLAGVATCVGGTGGGGAGVQPTPEGPALRKGAPGEQGGDGGWGWLEGWSHKHGGGGGGMGGHGTMTSSTESGFGIGGDGVVVNYAKVDDDMWYGAGGGGGVVLPFGGYSAKGVGAGGAHTGTGGNGGAEFVNGGSCEAGQSGIVIVRYPGKPKAWGGTIEMRSA